MINLRDLARIVITEDWGVPGPAFDAMWSTLAAVPEPKGQIDTQLRRVLDQSALAASSTRIDNLALGVAFFTFAAQELGDNAKPAEVLSILTTLGKKLGDPATSARIMQSCEKALAVMEGRALKVRAATSDATCYRHPTQRRSTSPGPERLTEEAVAKLLREPPKVDIFIHHQRDLRCDMVGRVYFRGQRSDKDFQPRAYCVLRYLLKHHHDESHRTILDLVEACWEKVPALDVQQLRKKDWAAVSEATHTHRNVIPDLNRILIPTFDKKLEAQKKIYSFVPSWPSYCVIEEQ